LFLDHTLIKVFLDDMQTESPYGVEVIGSVAEWSIAPVLKNGAMQRTKSNQLAWLELNDLRVESEVDLIFLNTETRT